ncbi:dapper homolog 2 [Callorhinchus milii]|uniref:dapper homolog 2 n=1 Tax=Callorhinchus milii TaxID=7868 RepID=UPI001C3FD86D|nr:dapper homolog 2 [Callorhinchus milii]
MSVGERAAASPPGGLDRSRAGERLRAALAGLQELHLLRERQRGLVREALGGHSPRPTAPAGTATSRTQEQRLEATLTALKEQLSHLRKQDVGLKSHLQHLDRQISELKLDVSKASSDQLESDSRPSSGFYDLSDGGSCSLSNSCTSVYSECMSSSQSSLLCCTQQPEAELSKSDYRPRSADETMVQATDFRRRGVFIRPGRGIRTTIEPVSLMAKKSGVLRQRPVSTGDLERIRPTSRGFPSASDLKQLSSMCTADHLRLRLANQRYRCDLVSKNSSDVYNYPSPLHAVALQSPLFSLTGEAPGFSNRKILASESLTSTTPFNPVMSWPPVLETTFGHKPKLSQQSTAGEIRTTAVHGDFELNQQTAAQKSDISQSFNGMKNNSNHKAMVQTVAEQQDSNDGHYKDLGLSAYVAVRLQEAGHGSIKQLREDSEASIGVQIVSKLDMKDLSKAKCISGSVACSDVPVQTNPKETAHYNPIPKAEMSQPTSQISSEAKKAGEALPKSDFVHAQFVPAKSQQRVKVRQANRKTKVVKIKRRSSERGRAVKQGPIEKLRDTGEGPGIPIDVDLHHKKQRGRAAAAFTSPGSETTGRSCSESILYPVCYGPQQLTHRPETQKSAVPGLHVSNAKGLMEGMKKKQRKWQSSVEIFTRVPIGHLCYGTGGAVSQHKQQMGKAERGQNVSFRSRTFENHFSVYSYARSESDQSEYSAECASLFHSTIVETSEDDESDHTTNCFGDGELSGGSVSDTASNSSLSLDDDDPALVWPQGLVAANEPTSSSCQPRHSEAQVCRIKASKALKKKIRRFQPDSLKIMTMV